MKALRGTLDIFASRLPEDRMADLKVKDLTLAFGDVAALNNVELTVKTGELVGIAGPGGAGKTSLLDCITGVRKPQSGRIFFNGKDITTLPIHRLAALGIARTYQNIELDPNRSVLTNMRLARHIHSRYNIKNAFFFSEDVREEEAYHLEVIENLIAFLEIQPIRKRTAGSLTRGMRKRVELGRALALEPALLVLDEPFAGMTIEEKEDTARFLMELNQEYNLTIILVEQDMSMPMSISERVVVLDFGVKIAEGTPDFVRNHPLALKAYHG